MTGCGGTNVFSISTAVPEQDWQPLGVLFDVAETFSIDNGQTPVDTSADLTDLHQSHAEICAP